MRARRSDLSVAAFVKMTAVYGHIGKNGCVVRNKLA